VEGADGSFYGSSNGTIFKDDSAGNFTALYTSLDGDEPTIINGLLLARDGNFTERLPMEVHRRSSTLQVSASFFPWTLPAMRQLFIRSWTLKTAISRTARSCKARTAAGTAWRQPLGRAAGVRSLS
jgi:hypothetical protein